MSMAPGDRFDDLLVRVGNFNAEQQAYPVQVSSEAGRDFSGWLRLQDLREPAAGDPRALTSYGITLFNRLFAAPLDDAFYQAWASALAREHRLRLRLWIDSEDVHLHNVSWELMHYDASGGTSPPLPLSTSNQVAFSRYLGSSRPWGQPIVRWPLRIVIAVAAPNDLGPAGAWPDLVAIDRASEHQDLDSRFSMMRQSGLLDYTFLPQVTPPALLRALDENYDVLLFFGHAMHRRDFGTRLVLEDPDSGAGLLFDGEELVVHLAQAADRPSLIILVACNTAANADKHPLENLAARLVRHSGVPAVLAMRRLVEVTLARNFTHLLSEHLLRHGVIDVAVNAARLRVYDADDLGWTTPVLYMHRRDGRLFLPNPLLEYTQAIWNDPQFSRWNGNEFIPLEVLAVPTGYSWRMLKQHPENAPPATDALTALEHALQLDRSHAEPNLVALIGPPHSGQTTVIRRFVWDLANAARQAEGVASIVGIYVPLAGYEQQHTSGSKLERLISESARERVPTLGPELERLFRPGAQPADPVHYVFLLDGLDSLALAAQFGVISELETLAARLPDQRFVLSCSQDYLPETLEQVARVLLLLPLNERQVLRYLRQREPERSVQLFRRVAEYRLLDLAADPALLQLIYERLISDHEAVLTRSRLLQDVVERALSQISWRFTQGDAAYETLLALAWEFRWRHQQTLPLNEVFTIMARIRRERDYNLEELYQSLRDLRLLTSVGQNDVRFVQPALLDYCAAQALLVRPDFRARLDDIVSMCGASQRLEWWENTLYALAGVLRDPAPLAPLGMAAIPENSSAHTLLLARCLEALSEEARARLSEEQQRALIDACALRLNAEREPSFVRRAQIATALGRLAHPQAARELKRILIERVRMTRSGPRYEYSTVRIAAARALRTLLARLRQEGDTAALFAVAAQQAADAQTVCPPDVLGTAEAVADAVRSEAALVALFNAWDAETATGRRVLRETLECTTNSAPERAIAAFALGDLAADAADAELLLAIIVRDRPAEIPPPEWRDTIWAAADALTLFDAEQVAAMLVKQLAAQPTINDWGIEQLAYVAGRVRAADPGVVGWMLQLLVLHPNHIIKAKLLQSLTWLGPTLADVELPQLEGSAGALLCDLIQHIAAWDLAFTTSLGAFTIRDLPAEHVRSLYLRRKAIEGLTWVGDLAMVEGLYDQLTSWPLELREAWYISVEAVRSRTRE